MKQESTPRSAVVPAVAPLTFAIDIEGGNGTLLLENRPLSRLARIEKLAMDIPDLRFPFDLSAGSAGFRHRRCRLRSVELSVGLGDLRRFVSDADLPAYGIKQATVHGEGNRLVFEAHIEIGGASAQLLAQATLRSVPSRRLRLVVFDCALYGFVPVPAPLLVTSLFKRLGRLAEEPRPGVSLSGPTEIEIEPLDLALFDLLPRRGWRLPARTHVQGGVPGFERDRIVLRFHGLSGGRADAAGPGEQETDEETSLFEVGDPTTRTGSLIAYEEGRALFSEGEQALLQGDLVAAVAAFRRGLVLHPDNGFVATRLLQLLMSSRSTFADADELASALLARRPRFVPALLTRAVLATERGALAEAVEIYERLVTPPAGTAVGRFGPSREILCALARAAELRFRMGEVAPALAAIERVRAADPSHPGALDLLRRIYSALGRSTDWLAVLRRRELDEADPRARAALACEAGEVLFSQLEQPALAGDRFAQAVLLDEHLGRAWAGLGRAQAASGNPEAAIASLERALAIAREGADPAELVPILGALAEAEERLGRDGRAERTLAEAAALVPGGEPKLALRRARVLARLDRGPQACDILRTAISEQRDSEQEPVLRTALAEILAQTGNLPRARIEVEDVLRVQPACLPALRLLAAWAGNGASADVLMILRRAIESGSDGERLREVVALARDVSAQGGDPGFVERVLLQAARLPVPAAADAAILLAETCLAHEPPVGGPPGTDVAAVTAVVAGHVKGAQFASLRGPARLGLARALATLSERSGDEAGAVAALEIGLECDPSTEVAVAAWRRIVELKARGGDAAGAARALIASADDARTGHTAETRAALLVTAAEIMRERLRLPDDALPLLDRATVLDPHNTAAFDALESAAEEAGDLERLAEVIGRRCDSARLAERRAHLARLGTLLANRLGRPAEAARAFDRALEVDRDFVPALMWLARWNWERGDSNTAIEQYGRVVAVDARLRAPGASGVVGGPTPRQISEAHLRIAQLARVVGQLAEAERHLERGLANEPEVGAPLAVLVDVLEGAGEFETLVTVLRKRLTDPGGTGAPATADREAVELALARALERGGRAAEAVAIYERRLQAASEKPDAVPEILDILARLAEIHRREARFSDLIAVLQRSLALHPEAEGVVLTPASPRVPLMLELARAYFQSEGTRERAEPILRRLLAALPGLKEAAETLARILLARGAWVAADAVLAEAGIVRGKGSPRSPLDAESPLGGPRESPLGVLVADPTDVAGIVRAAWERLASEMGEVAAYALLRPVALDRLPPDGLALRGDLAQRLSDRDDLKAVVAQWRTLTNEGRAVRWKDHGLRLIDAAARDPDTKPAAIELLENLAEAMPGEAEIVDRLLAVYQDDADPRRRQPGFAILCGQLAAATVERRVGLALKVARLYREEGELAAAEAQIESVLELDLPPAARFAMLLEHASLAMARRDLEAALEDLEEVLALSPNHPGALALLGELSYREQDWAQARLAYQALAKLGGAAQVIDPALLAARRSELAETFGDEVEAEACYRELVKLQPDNPAAHDALARFAVLRNEFRDAATHLETILGTSPLQALGNLTDVRERLAEAYLRLADFSQAREQLELVLRDEPERITALERLLVALEELQAFAEAGAVCGRLSRLYPEARARAEILYRQGEIQRLRMLEPAVAADSYLRAADMDPSFVPALLHLVEHYWNRGDLVGVAEVAADLIRTGAGREALAESNGGQVGLMAALATAAGARDLALARKLLPPAVLAPVPSRAVDRQVAHLAARLPGLAFGGAADRLPGAIGLLSEIWGEPETLYRLRAGCQAALAEEPADLLAMGLLGRLAERAGEPAAARAAYSVVVLCDPDSPFVARLRHLPPLGPPAPSALMSNALVHLSCAGAARRVLAALAFPLIGLVDPGAEDGEIDAGGSMGAAADDAIASALAGIRSLLSTPMVNARAGAGGALELRTAPEAAMIVGAELALLPRAELDFYLAVALDQLRSGTAVVERLGTDRFRDLFIGIAVACKGLADGMPTARPTGDPGFARAVSNHLRHQVAGLPDGPAREELFDDALAVIESPPDFEVFLGGCRHTANRVGLLVCGDPLAGLQAVLHVGRPGDVHGTDPASPAYVSPSKDLARADSPLRELATFLLSDGYAACFTPAGARKEDGDRTATRP